MGATLDPIMCLQREIELQPGVQVRQEEADLIEPGVVVRIALIALAGWVTAVWVCGAIYVAVSYVEAARFTS